MRSLNTAVAVGAAALLVGGGLYLLNNRLDRDPAKGIVPAGLFLTPTGVVGAPCAAKVVPFRIQARKKESIEWTIVDLCNGTAGYTKDVELRWVDVADKCNGNNSPLDPPENPKGKQGIKRRIHQNCPDEKIFRYEIWLEGSRLADPEVEIVM